MRRPSFLSSPHGGFVFLLLVILFEGRTCIGVFGFCVRSIAAMEAAYGLLGLSIGLFLWRLVRCQDQLDSVSVPPSMSIPRIIVGSTLEHLPRDMPVKHMDGQNIMTTYRTGRAGQLVPAVHGGVRPRFAGLKKHLPDVLVRGAEKLSQGLVLGRIEFP